jgi:hypothetical protein
MNRIAPELIVMAGTALIALAGYAFRVLVGA